VLSRSKSVSHILNQFSFFDIVFAASNRRDHRMKRTAIASIAITFCSATVSTALQAREFSGVSTKASHACTAGEAITVSGTSQKINLSGACGALTVQGVSNIVRVQQVESIQADGMRNTVQYGSTGSGAKPRISVQGVSTTVSPDAALKVVQAAPAAPAGRSASAPVNAERSASDVAAKMIDVDACDATQTFEGISNNQSIQCEAGDRLLFSGVSMTATVVGDCAAVCVDGTNNRVNVQGNALAIAVSGTTNIVSAMRVDAIRIDGMTNQVNWRSSFHPKGPKTQIDGLNNGVSKRQ
jgi:hypothetical protein